MSMSLNAFTFEFDQKLLEPLRQLFESVNETLNADPSLTEGGQSVNRELENHSFYITSYGEYPLLWISANDRETYDVFDAFFRALDIVDDAKLLVDFDETLVMYGAFFVVGNVAPHELFHVDYFPDSHAYTLLTPLDAFLPEHGNLSFKLTPTTPEQHGLYNYKMGEAIIFGEQFEHSTQPYAKQSRNRILVSLTFGTDKMQYWETLKKTVGTQSNFVMLPCGHQQGTCNCVEKQQQ